MRWRRVWSSISPTFGNFQIRLNLPSGVQSEMLPAYIQPFDGDVLPLRSSSISMEIATRRNIFHDQENNWTFFGPLPMGACRPDRLPIDHVIPAIHHVLADAGVIPLHASGIIHEGEAVLFAGKSGSGKSTTAESFVRHGCTLLADDRVLIWKDPATGALLAIPSFELGNPFSRLVGHVPETGRRPPRRFNPPYGHAYPIREIFFIEIGLPSIKSLSAAEIHAQLIVHSGGRPLPPDLRIPARNLTVGDDLPKIFL